MSVLDNFTNQLGGLTQQKVVAIYTDDFTEVFASARHMKVSVNLDAKVMDQPLETGASIVDHMIFLPVQLEISMLMYVNDFQNTYQEIKQLRDNKTLISVQTQTDTYKNQLIQAMPHDEDPELNGAILVVLKTVEANFVTSQQGAEIPREPKNSRKVTKGTQQTSNSGDSYLHEIVGLDKSHPIKISLKLLHRGTRL